MGDRLGKVRDGRTHTTLEQNQLGADRLGKVRDGLDRLR